MGFMRRLGLFTWFERFMEVPGSVDTIIVMVVIALLFLGLFVRLWLQLL